MATGEKKRRIGREINDTTGLVTFTVLDGGATLVVDPKKYPAAIQARLLAHGVNAKVGDSAADPEEDAMEALTATHEQLLAGNWAQHGGGGGGPRLGELIAAIVTVTGQPEDKVRAKVEKMTDDERAEARKHPQIAAAMAKAAAEKAAARAKDLAKGTKDTKAFTL